MSMHPLCAQLTAALVAEWLGTQYPGPCHCRSFSRCWRQRLCQRAKTGQWAWECKWDGWRALLYVDRGMRVRTRTGRQVSDSLPELAGLVDALEGHRVIQGRP